MNLHPDGRGSPQREEARETAIPAFQAFRAKLDCEALEHFAEALAILREWDEVERRETGDDDGNADAAGA